MKLVIISGTQSGVGSTTVSISLMNLLRKQGLRVQAFKFGPSFHENDLFEMATGRMAVNLVPWSCPRDCLLSCLCRCATECDIGVIDGSAGLFDRCPKSQGWSTAELARLLMVPVILVVDAKAMGQSCAALVKGFENHEKKVKVVGVVLNRVSDLEHAQILMKALAKDGVKAEFVGSIVQKGELFVEWDYRHQFAVKDFLQEITEMGQNLNTDKFIEIAAGAKVPKSAELEIKKPVVLQVKIAVAKDAAFSFYYHENFVLLEAAGAELVFFSPLVDDNLPEEISAIYLGGGHPELHLHQLTKNFALMSAIRAFAGAGGVIYAEGGGLSYLSQSIEQEYEYPVGSLVGLFPFKTVFLEDPHDENMSVTVEILNNCPIFPPGSRAKGYISSGCGQIRQENIVSPWDEGENKAHTANPDSFDYVYRLNREDVSCSSAKEGYSKNCVLASYVHLQFASDQRLATYFVKKCQEVDQSNVQDAMKQALMNMSIQIVKNGTPRSANSSRRMISPESSFKSRRIPKHLEIKTTNGYDEDYDCHDNEVFDKKLPSFQEQQPHQQQQLQTQHHYYARGMSLDRRYTSVYSCQEMKLHNRNNADPYPTKPLKIKETLLNTTSKMMMEPRRPDLRKSFSLDDMGAASRGEKTHFGNTKIVGLSSTGVEMVCALGLDQRLIAVTNLCKYPKNIQNGRRVVATTKFEASHLDDSRLELKLKDFWCRQESAFVIDEEYLRQEQPSLVIVEEGGDPGRHAVEQIFKTRKGSFTGLCTKSPTAVLAHKCLHLSEILQFMLRIAQGAGIEDTGAVVVDKLRARIGKIGSLIAADFPVEKVVVLTCLNPLMTGGYWIPEMVTLAGGECLGAKAGHSHQRVTWQELKNLEPEVLILAAASWEETKQELAQLASLPGWWVMPAMKTGHLYVCEPSLFSMAGPRLVDGIELLARILHPSFAGTYGKQGMAWSCTLRAGKRCRPSILYRQFCALL